jgi:hypothetical protein
MKFNFNNWIRISLIINVFSARIATNYIKNVNGLKYQFVAAHFGLAN